MEAPDKIWASEAKPGYGEWQTKIDGLPDPAAYIRSDLVPQWKPIETAPRDGTRILAYQADRESKIYECFWRKEWTDDEQYWMDDADSEPEPTHWMPLPKPPEGV